MGPGPISNSPLSGWINFYEVVGSASGALTGLQFVVITLISNIRAAGTMQGIRAFATPTVVHFCVALLISATMSAPWHELSTLSYCLAAYAVAGIAYSIKVVWHARKAEYDLDVEDWFWYSALQLLAYASLIAAAILLWWRPNLSLFLIGAIDLQFLFIGIHNSWDTVTYIAITQRRDPDQGGSNQQS